MKINNKFRYKYFVLLPLLVTQAGLAQNQQQKLISQLNVPENLKVPTGQTLVLKVSAKGTQIYQCQAKVDNLYEFEWIFKAPQAYLFDNKGQKIGKHYAGPTWEANDGSKVIGQVKSRANSPNQSAIPWLLLEAKSNEGNGIFSKVKYIQRVNTVGGKAPTRGCDITHRNSQLSVSYSSNYYFYKAVP
ncbi:DUF3455 domain-containing protein [Nostoc sp.]|uniref:DUF3455 domain-containing protein n=1 Tax=Nostoc sp. TaxID=1180 RepID=UPI002FF846C1